MASWSPTKAHCSRPISRLWEFVDVGEIGLAFETLCTQLDEYDIQVEVEAAERLEELGTYFKVDPAMWRGSAGLAVTAPPRPAAVEHYPGPMRLRESVRALIVDGDDNVLLLRFDWPGCDVPGGFWANPGGGIEPGESRLAALRRELREEVGLAVTELGPEVWTKTAVFPMAGYDGQIDHIHLHRVAHFAPAPALPAERLRSENVHEIRWWPAADIRRGGAVFAPRGLPTLLPPILASGAPPHPITLHGF